MKVAGKCLGVGPGKGNAVVVTLLNDLDGEPRELDVRCWGDRFHEVTRTIRTGDRVVVEGHVETKSWQKRGTDGPPMRFTNFNATSIVVVNPDDNAPPADDEDIPF